jgi:hypothetical protein
MKLPLSLIIAGSLVVPVSLPAALSEWQAAVESAGTTPSATYLKGLQGPAISGFEPVVLDVGTLSGPRSFEFIVNAGAAGSSSALIGLAGVQGLKFEQNFETGHVGITDYGIADHDSPVPSPLHQDSQIVFTCDGTDTRLYINGTAVHTFTGVDLVLSGPQTLGGVSDGVGGAVFDRLDGHILGFASYASELTAAEIAAHHTAFKVGSTPVSFANWRNAVTSGTTPPANTVFSPISGMAPVLSNLGELSGPRTFEFLVNAGEAGRSEALMGRSGLQGLKFDQWDSTGFLGLTAFGVADHVTTVPSPYNTLTQITWVSQDTGTDLYIDGVWQQTLDGVPISLSGFVSLGAAATITGLGGVTVYRDPLDGQVLRFASYDNALTEAEVNTHYQSFQQDGGAQTFSAWQSTVNSGSPATVILEATHGSEGRSVDVGTLSGGRSFEFIVNAGLGNASGSLLGGNSQALKFEQWQDTGSLGITEYGVADYNSSIPAPELTDTHLVYSSDGTDTQLFVNGVLSYTFTGVALTGTGQQGLATAAVLPIITASYFDRLDGHILGFASYAEALPPAEIAAHYAALLNTTPVAPGPFVITGISRNTITGAITLTWSSDDGATYRIDYSETPGTFPHTAVAGIPATLGGTTSRTFAAPSTAERLFFRIVRL